MSEYRMSLFESVNSTIPLIHITLDQLLAMVKIPKVKTKTLILRAREANYGSEEYVRLKKQLPLITIAGTFDVKKDDSLQTSSGLACFDLDSSNRETILDLKAQIATDEFTFVLFDSISGGFRLIVKIPIVTSHTQYKEYYQSFTKYLSEKYNISTNKKDETHIDTSCTNISRGWFLSTDENIVRNDESYIWEERYIEQVDNTPIKKDIPINYRKVMLPLDMVKNAIKGERHEVILKASNLMGAYIAAGLIDRNEAFRLLIQEASIITPDQMDDSRKAIIDGLKRGESMPIDGLEIKMRELEEEGDLIIKYGKIYYNVDDVREEIDMKHKNGVQRGYDIGFYSMRENYTVKMGGTTYIYGRAASGKTYILFQMLLNLSRMYGLKHAVMSEEMGNASDIYIELAMMYIGRDFYNDYNNSMTKEQVDEAMIFIKKHFLVIDCADTSLTVTDFYEYINTIERVHNVKIHTTTIDPWNSLTHDIASEYGGRQDLYLENKLGYIRKDATRNQRHNFIVTHGTKSQKTKDNLQQLPLDIEDVSGGVAFSRKGLCMISVYLPKSGFSDFVSESENREFQPYEMYLLFQKVKPNGIGKKGNKRIYLDPHRHQYYELIDGKKFYALEFNQENYDETEEVNYNYSSVIIDDSAIPF